jgi:hypothetical protein
MSVSMQMTVAFDPEQMAQLEELSRKIDALGEKHKDGGASVAGLAAVACVAVGSSRRVSRRSFLWPFS